MVNQIQTIAYGTHIISVALGCDTPPICDAVLEFNNTCPPPSIKRCTRTPRMCGGVMIREEEVRQPTFLVQYPLHEINIDGGMDFYVDDKLDLLDDLITGTITITYKNGQTTVIKRAFRKAHVSVSADITFTSGGCTRC